MKKETGKGGNIDVRRNPFLNGAGRRAVMPELALEPRLGLVLDTIIRQGCAIIIGSTRDGGALVLTVLDGDQRHRTYCSTNDEVGEALTALELTFAD